jgi:putative acyl-CoA dehydrogenase
MASAPSGFLVPTATHEVVNQPPPLAGYNLFDEDPALAEGLSREGGGWALPRVRSIGALTAGDPMRWGVLANAHPPFLRTHDRSGHRIDEVEYHPAWHDLMRTAVAHELHALPWRAPGPGAHVARAAMYYVFTQAEQGHGCPITMTFAVVPALKAHAGLAATWIPLLTSAEYDPRPVPAARKRGALAGMAMTEKQGGSDVRANTTRARPAGADQGPGAGYALLGHKWFCSAPMCDVFLTLAQAPGGLSCFVLPRLLPDGTRNAIEIQRLKDKLGNRSNASSEIELRGALAWMLGEEGRGVATIMGMVAHTRLDCVIGSSALMRQAVSQAAHHVAHRSAFGRRLVEQPLMQNVLADLALEAEAAAALMLRLARAYDEAAGGKTQARAFARLATAIGKYWVCKRAVTITGEALECLGGGGYVEECVLPRLAREAPVNSIWEGSGNVICLDVMTTMRREPDALAAVLEEMDAARGVDRRLDGFVDAIREGTRRPAEGAEGRRLVGRLARALQASLLVRHAPAAISDAFVASRIAGDHGYDPGTLPAGLDLPAIIERATPRVGAQAGAIP